MGFLLILSFLGFSLLKNTFSKLHKKCFTRSDLLKAVLRPSLANSITFTRRRGGWITCKCVLSAANGRFNPALDQAALKQSRTKLFNLLGKEAVAPLFLLWLWRCKFLMAVNRIGWFVYSTGRDVTHQWKKKNLFSTCLKTFTIPCFIGVIEKKLYKKPDSSHMPEYADFAQVKY